MKTFRDRVAVVTGAASGIGRALAEKFASEGMKVVLADVEEAPLAATAKEMTDAGATVLAVRTDVSKPAEIEALADRAWSAYGAVHVLCNNAGVGGGGLSWEVSAGEWDWVLGVNLFGVIHGVRIFVPRMLAGGDEGHVVNTASVAGLVSQPAMAAYNVSKFGVVTLTEGLHHDLTLRKTKLKASVLCPGWVKTRIAESDRHREADERTDPRQLDAVSAKTGLSMFKAVQQGIAPEQVADDVFAAVENEKFYILTHPETKAGVHVRKEDILKERPPTLLPV